MASPRTQVAVIGAAGRIGQRLCRAVAEDARFLLAGAADRAAGAPAAGVPLTTDLAAAVASAAVVIDFSAPAAAALVAPLCATRGAAYLVGSTALTENDRAALTAASARVPVLAAANFSVGVNVLLELVERAAAALGEGFDVELFELHHRGKRDAPSGTALNLGDAARRGRPGLTSLLGRQGAHQRAADELGIAAARGGDASGEHTVFFLGAGERLELVHRATTPEIFVAGALRAAAWIAGRPPGQYTMRDVLGG